MKLPIAQRTVKLLLAGILFVVFVLALIATLIIAQFPSDKEITGCLTTKLYQVRLCPGSSDYVRLSQISPYLQKSIVLTEDSSFWQHNGFDLQEIERSLKTNMSQGKFVRGGSTITQQLAKNMFLSKDKTLTRKLFEALITMRIERLLDKKQILERYLNVVQFGKGIFGVKSAAQYYFSKSPADLTVVESAFLTFLLPSPEKYSKSFYQGQLTPFARTRIETIIERMHDYGRIDGGEYFVAQEDLSHFLTGKPALTDSEAPTQQELENIVEEEVVPEE